ncbi:amino acid adenylation domain-containing protein [Saccharicrinis sp. FJH54]|uniref:non-ribosomal peptide synthetase n=1 Tax=Saccharicrinis sp. FJH54 TaxID=3344665 RepID=UPI0035D4D3A9
MPLDICIHHVLETQAAKTPEHIAVRYLGASLNYGQLNNYANALANRLIEKHVQIEDFVLVYMNRRLELIISIFGILKTGGVYVPVSGDYPKQRLLDILQDTKARIIITEEKYRSNIPEGPEIISIDSFLERGNELFFTQPEVNVKPYNLAYCIFTSGSTGKPKGVLIEHRSVINRIAWMQKEYPINSSDTLLQKTTITFDVSIWELFWWSFTGASVVLLPNTHEKNPARLFDCIEKEKITVVHFVPSMFNASLSYLKSVYPDNKTQTLKWLFCSGEALSSNSVKDFYALSNLNLKNKTILTNLYGPTEATVDVTYYTCPVDVPTTIPIGKAIDNTQIYIVDENNRILPPEVEGELVICGVNLARGYLNRTELTNEKFITIEVDQQKVRAYKSGDRAYIDDNGNIIYKGRCDNQVKIRGYRIELGEIENNIAEIDGINECACIVDKKGTSHAQIICFYSSSPGNYQKRDFKKQIGEKLPPFMIPSKFIDLKDMPRTSSGKIDRKKLSSAFEQKLSDIQPVKNPGNNIDQQIIEIWKNLLNVDTISLNTNFFDLGANSILLVQFTLLLKEMLQIDMDVLTVFQFSTVQSLADHIKSIKPLV